ncbi:hypothetical protein B0T26DRAFT_479121 [Lasiosphaeria miniovina]|uniref:Peptidase S8/S53 domain-containing protein n=1 Tax=Lasiosphaeria miniovina TaxID=1954250 RepID=A0AA40A0D4_9PEZI|nr:uncharacterized protein B0T26DRAFT_479121 [Lasiosphaeria miniovina]KAK0706905.1 hypothetical protein B0T26DRAFT_479121 [Lasiosphaeria miniovina]
MDSYLHHYICRSQRTMSQSKPLNQPHVKIAIIDSEINLPSVRDIQNMKLTTRTRNVTYGIDAKIKDRRNFCAGAIDDCTDQVGHGTKAAWLLHKVPLKPSSTLPKSATQLKFLLTNHIKSLMPYIGQLPSGRSTSSLYLSALMVRTIVSIELDAAEELGLHVITFAASGNGGGNVALAWLAQKPGIIAVHATDGLGSEAGFSQRASHGKGGEASRDFQFATLGKDIP